MAKNIKNAIFCVLLLMSVKVFSQANNCPNSVEAKTFSLVYLITDDKPDFKSIVQCQEVEYKANGKTSIFYYLVHLHYDIRGSNLDYLVLFYKAPNAYNGLTSNPVLASYIEIGSNSSYLIVSKFSFINNEISIIGSLPPLNFESNKERHKKLVFSIENGNLRKIREEEQ